MKKSHIYLAIYIWIASTHASQATVIEIDDQGNPHAHEVLDFRYHHSKHKTNGADSKATHDNIPYSNAPTPYPNAHKKTSTRFMKRSLPHIQ